MTPRLCKLAPFAMALALLTAPVFTRADAQAPCKDGTRSTASGRGACSGHGGVAKVVASSKAADRTAKGGRVAYVPKPSAQVACKDGTSSANGRGACSHHGGIGAAAAPAMRAPAPGRALPPMSAPRTAPAPSRTGQVPAGATAQCKDGTYSNAKNRRGACSRHGGVATWM
jgi:hypothetical protein